MLRISKSIRTGAEHTTRPFINSYLLNIVSTCFTEAELSQNPFLLEITVCFVFALLSRLGPRQERIDNPLLSTFNKIVCMCRDHSNAIAYKCQTSDNKFAGEEKRKPG